MLTSPVIIVFATSIIVGCCQGTLSSEAVKDPASSTEKFLREFEDALPRNAAARLGSLRFRADFGIQYLAISPDGKTVAGAADNKIFLWDGPTGQIRRVISGSPTEAVSLAAFSAKGRQLLLVLYRDGSISFLDPDGKMVRRIKPAEPAGISHAAISADAAVLAYEGFLTPLTFVNLDTGKAWRSVDIPDRRLDENQLQAFCLSPDGKTLALTFVEKSDVHFWDLATGKLLKKLQCRPGHLLDWSLDGNFLATANLDGGSRLWNLQSGAEVLSFDVGAKVKFTPDGKKLLAWDDQQLVVVDVKSHAVSTRIKWSVDSPESLPAAVSPDGRTLAIGSEHGVVRRWDLSTGRELLSGEGHQATVTDIVFDRTGTLLKTSSWDRTVRAWEAQTGKLLKSTGFPKPLSISPNGKWGAFGNFFDQKVWLWDLAMAKRLDKVFDGVTDYRFAANSQLVLGTPEKHLIFVDVTSQKETKRTRLKDADFGNFVFSDDLRWAAGRLLKGDQVGETVMLWDVNSGDVTRQFSCNLGTVKLSSDSRMLASTGRGVQIFEVQTEKLIRRIPALDQDMSLIDAIAFSLNGRILSTGNRFGAIVLWDVLTGKRLDTFRGHIRGITCLRFSPDGAYLASGSSDTTVVLWNVPKIENKPPVVRLDNLWDDLASDNTIKAYEAIAVFPYDRSAVDYLGSHLRPVQPADPNLMRRLAKDLNSASFEKREAAAKEIADLGDLAIPELRRLEAESDSLEVRRRAAKLVEQAKGPVRQREEIRALRAVQVLECCPDRAGEALLRKLSAGASESRVTQEVRLALQRLVGKAQAPTRACCP